MAQKTRPPTSGTRKGNGRGHGGAAKGQGLWGEANGPGWCAGLRRPITANERARLREEMTSLYLTIARDTTQPALIRMQAARHLLDRLDNPYLDMTF